MKKFIIVSALVFGVVAAIAIFSSSSNQSPKPNRDYASNPTPMTQQAPRVPAHFEDVARARPFKETLDPEQFAGKTRQAYQVAKEIPETLAQLPCYCYCDQGFGHKSLHSCYEDDHSAHCSTCVDEALMAYQLQKQQNLTPAQIRERIIQHFSR